MEIWKLVAILFAIILLIVLGSKAVYKNNFVVISGNLKVAANNSNVANISYPEGFNAENCVPISCGLQNIANKGYNYVGYNKDSGSILSNAYDRRLNLTSSNIVLIVDNPATSEKTVSYKIVLMKTN